MRRPRRPAVLVGAVAAAAVVASAAPAWASSCAGPYLDGAVGLVTQGDTLAVVVAERGDVGEGQVLDGRPLRAVPLDEDGRPAGPSTPWAGPPGATGADRVTRDEVVGPTRIRLHDHGAGDCGEPTRWPQATAELADGRLVVAMADDGLAVERRDGGFDRIGVAGHAPVPLSILDGPGVLVHLPRLALPAVVAAAVVWWLLAVARPRPDGPRRWTLALVPPIVALPVAAIAAFAGFIAGSEVLFEIAPWVVIAAVTAGAGRLGRPALRPTVGRAIVVGAVPPLLFLLGLPGEQRLWVLAGALAAAAVVLRDRGVATAASDAEHAPATT